MDSLEGSINDVMTAEINCRVNEVIRDKIELDVRYISSNTDIWYFINSCLNSGLQQVVATFYAAGEGDMIISSINYAKGKEKCPKLKRSYPTKVKKAMKRQESSDKSPIEELGSSEAEESLGKE
ncbi:pol-like protein [Colletotrichum kahawae]|uniref:Pol-like protein n=1 Tax=Colletotrichum kahawae TaxID=34407 RepID=A0AAD9YCY4_COLKA|nr:pol-like protein [Colletotrichum kahawae]